MCYLSSQDSNCNLAATQGHDSAAKAAQKKKTEGDAKLISNFFKPKNSFNNQVASLGRNLRYKDQQIANSQLSGEWTTFVSGDTSLMQPGASAHHQPVQQMQPRMLIMTPQGERESRQTTSSNKKQQSQRVMQQSHNKLNQVLTADQTIQSSKRASMTNDHQQPLISLDSAKLTSPKVTIISQDKKVLSSRQRREILSSKSNNCTDLLTQVFLCDGFNERASQNSSAS